jgi:hypothetical protein
VDAVADQTDDRQPQNNQEGGVPRPGQSWPRRGRRVFRSRAWRGCFAHSAQGS